MLYLIEFKFNNKRHQHYRPIHSLKHDMRDRLRAVECSANLIDQIGGRRRKGV